MYQNSATTGTQVQTARICPVVHSVLLFSTDLTLSMLNLTLSRDHSTSHIATSPIVATTKGTTFLARRLNLVMLSEWRNPRHNPDPSSTYHSPILTTDRGGITRATRIKKVITQ